jgi:hypothetical protein
MSDPGLVRLLDDAASLLRRIGARLGDRLPGA